EKEQIAVYKDIYEAIGYDVFVTNDEPDKEAIKDYISGKTAVIAGQSGVGKSTLLNSLNSDLTLKTAEISNSLGRGKHTTRHVEL
ncbi:GTPase RsgA, partial [Klebsiella pneumoniae]|nr:GTPase RsgA [Klebsiella pneumoniae]